MAKIYLRTAFQVTSLPLQDIEGSFVSSDGKDYVPFKDMELTPFVIEGENETEVFRKALMNLAVVLISAKYCKTDLDKETLFLEAQQLIIDCVEQV